MRAARPSAIMILLVLLPSAAARAQLSPGPLSRAHESLEGLTRCTECHRLGNRAVEAKCLECHVEIAERIEAGRGLHARPDHAACASCHVEHQGRDFELVHWPDGRERFDHSTTGFELAGVHARRECRTCHQPRYLADPAALEARDKDPARTWLGLGTTCAACHEDPHRRRLGADCAACHGQEAWRPAAGFDHVRTRFPLTGRHEQVDCAKCHRPDESRPAEEWVRFDPLPHAACTDCHRDPHAGALGPACAECHTTDTWRRVAGAGFDHSRTRYPLEGRHRQVRCEGCHGGDRAKPRFAACTDCHRDEHGGAAAGRPRWLACEACHAVEGFRPARFGLDQHAATAYPLQGAHRATPCSACHVPAGAMRFEFALAPATGGCIGCHRDPHGGRMDRFVSDGGGCAACHEESDWRAARFDHARTAFALDGAHGPLDCVRCHGDRARTDFGGLKTACAGCHADVHEGQFRTSEAADAAPRTCDDCHVTLDWFAEKFDHETGSRFPLRGGHERVACTACHPPVGAGNDRLLRFRPQPVECRACHAATPATAAPEEKR